MTGPRKARETELQSESYMDTQEIIERIEGALEALFKQLPIEAGDFQHAEYHRCLQIVNSRQKSQQDTDNEK